MLYPFKFNPVYKDYLWGGRELEKIGKKIPNGIVAESWDISCHKDGISTIANGQFEGQLLTDVIHNLGEQLVGSNLSKECIEKFPLLVKFIDANDKLSVQVHPNDKYAAEHENGELGKSEMWYILSAKPGAKIIYGLESGVTKEKFIDTLNTDSFNKCLKKIDVTEGDIINIPPGKIHAIGEGIVIVEIQQSSNTTYRVYDYDRKDKNGNKRPLHIEKALEVIDFSNTKTKEKIKGLEIKLDSNSSKYYKIANKYFAVEKYKIKGTFYETADGRKFCIYVCTDGEAEIYYNGGITKVYKGESILIPAAMGSYSIKGEFSMLKTYVPDISEDIIEPLKKAGYTEQEIFESVEGLV